MLRYFLLFHRSCKTSRLLSVYFYLGGPLGGLFVLRLLESADFVELEVDVVVVRPELAGVLVVFKARIDRLLLCLELHALLLLATGGLLLFE